MSTAARYVDAYRQAALESFDWARRTVEDGGLNTYFDGSHPMQLLRMVGVWTVGTAARWLPETDAQSFYGPRVEEEYEVLSIGAEAVVIKEGGYVRKVLTGKTEHPDELARKVAERVGVLTAGLGEHAVQTEVDVSRIKLFTNRNVMSYVTLTQPYLDIIKDDVLEDEIALMQDEGMLEQTQEVIKRLIRIYDSTGYIADLVNHGNVVLACENMSSQPKIRVPDVLAADIRSRDFVGLNLLGLWSPGIYVRALYQHANRIVALQDKAA